MSGFPPLPLSLIDMVLPDRCNRHGTLFGGAAIAMLEKLAFILGSKAMRSPPVTAAVHQLEFHAPLPAGWLTECNGRVHHRGRRLVTSDARLYAENLLTGERIRCLSGRFLMVATGQPEIVARVTGSGRTSLTVMAEMEAEVPETGERRCCTTAGLVFVAIDAQGGPVALHAGDRSAA